MALPALEPSFEEKELSFESGEGCRSAPSALEATCEPAAAVAEAAAVPAAACGAGGGGGGVALDSALAFASSAAASAVPSPSDERGCSDVSTVLMIACQIWEGEEVGDSHINSRWQSMAVSGNQRQSQSLWTPP